MASSGWMDNQNITECASKNAIKKARIPEWVVISFSRGFSRPRDWTHVSCITGIFFTTEPLEKLESHDNFTLILWGTAGSFSKASALFHIPISSWLQWLHILVNICWLFDSSHPNWYEVVAHCDFYFHSVKTKTVCGFLIGLSFFFKLNCIERFLFIPDISLSSNKWYLIICHSLGCLIFLMVFFEAWKLFFSF